MRKQLFKTFLASAALGLLTSSPSAHAQAVGDDSQVLYVEPGDAQLLFEGQLPPGEGDPAVPAQNDIARALVTAREAYAARWTGLPDIAVPAGPDLREGDSGSRVALLRQRLGLPQGDSFDAEMAAGVRLFRQMHGLSEAVIVDRPMIAALDLGPAHYLRILDANIVRAEQFPAYLGYRYVLVDLAAQQLQMVEHGDIADTMRVVVGRPETRTPFMAGLLRHVVLEPYWNVPADLVQSRYAQRILEGGSAYIQRAGFEVVSHFGEDAETLPHTGIDWRAVRAGEREVLLRQKPGPGNGMGDMKFMFPNALGIYLHDTPSTELFGNDQRLFSAGCVRLERPHDLGNWLFNGFFPTADATAGPEQIFEMPFPVPIYVGYFTARVEGDSILFADDIYDWDAGGHTAQNDRNSIAMR